MSNKEAVKNRNKKWCGFRDILLSKIAITTTSFGKYDYSPLELCEERGFKVIINPYARKLRPDELVDIARDSVGLIAGTEPITEDVLLKLPVLKVISRCGIGLDNIDMDAAHRLRIEVFNTPDAPTIAVAELTLGLILNLLRKVCLMDTAVKKGVWDKLMGNLLCGKRVGIIGFGRIGQKVAKLISVFDTKVAYCDLGPKVCSFNCGAKRFEEILGWADIILLHLSTTTDCNPVIGDKELKLMKKGSWLINASRGGVVDEDALYNALKNRHLLGAAIDVFEQEPYKGPLRDLDNVILTPHIGSYAREARVEMEKKAVENLLKGLEMVE